MNLERTERGWTTTWPEAGITVHLAPGDGPDTTAVTAEGDLLHVDGPLDATVELDPATSTRLVNGYQSWDYAGVRHAREAGHTWWGGALADSHTGAGLAFHALTAHRLATTFRTAPDGRTICLTAAQGEAPKLQPSPPGWGFHTPEAVPFDGAGHEPLVLTAAPDAFEAMEAVAEAAGGAMQCRRWGGPPVVGWESWYHYGFSVTPEAVLTNGRVMRERFPDRFRYLQIDDGWEAGYGDWRPSGDWPNDLSGLTAEIRDLGCIPGLWLAPFMVAPDSPGIGERSGLLVGHRATGARLVDPLMGRHAVDGTHPDALEWLHELGDRVRRWGFEMVKLDFLYLGAQEGVHHDPSATGIEALRRGLEAFVDGLGDDAYVLGCGMPVLPAVGLCHGNRVGGDLAAPIEWPFPELVPFDPAHGWLGIVPQARNAAARWWTHGRLFHNDTEVVMAAGSDHGPPYTIDEARMHATAVAVSGGLFLLADDLTALPDTKREVIEDPTLLELAWSEDGFRPVDLFDTPDESPDPDFFTLPTALPSRWEAVRSAGHTAHRDRPTRFDAHFDWDARKVRLDRPP